MDNDFYKFNHRCDDMPPHVHFCHLSMSTTPQFSINGYQKDKRFCTDTVIYDYKYCPYCGKSIKELEEEHNETMA